MRESTPRRALNPDARKIGGATLRSISDISRHQRLKDNNDEFFTLKDMLIELWANAISG